MQLAIGALSNKGGLNLLSTPGVISDGRSRPVSLPVDAGNFKSEGLEFDVDAAQQAESSRRPEIAEGAAPRGVFLLPHVTPADIYADDFSDIQRRPQVEARIGDGRLDRPAVFICIRNVVTKISVAAIE